ncbi:MAG: hypothetical protein JO157_12745 [Acetobacteraceae bacterium]|nr:hypothetical protein [Acetobacteraceae bacterium]
MVLDAEVAADHRDDLGHRQMGEVGADLDQLVQDLAVVVSVLVMLAGTVSEGLADIGEDKRVSLQRRQALNR